MRPILFSPAMSTASRAGTKTQTRRIIPGVPATHVFRGWVTCSTEKDDVGKGLFTEPSEEHLVRDPIRVRCPYGEVGDKLWVRETYYQRGHWEPIQGALTKGDRQKWKFIPADQAIVFHSPAGHRKGMHKETPDYITWHKRLARFMPRAYSRTTLEITAIRAERLQDITEEDAIAEGLIRTNGVTWEGFDHVPGNPSCMNGYFSARRTYQSLWESLHGPESWQENPYVWVITFKKI